MVVWLRTTRYPDLRCNVYVWSGHLIDWRVHHGWVLYCAETVIAFTKTDIHVVTSAKKGRLSRTPVSCRALARSLSVFRMYAPPTANPTWPGVLPVVAAVLRGVEEAAGGMGITLHVHVKPKGESGSEQMAALMTGVSASGTPPKLATLTKVWSSLATPSPRAIESLSMRTKNHIPGNLLICSCL